MSKLKINFSIDTEIAKKIDDYCEENGLSRSSFLTIASVTYLDAKMKQPKVGDAFGIMAKLAQLAVMGKTQTEEYDNCLAELEKIQVDLSK